MTTTNQHNLDRFFSGTVDDKMLEMKNLYGRHGKQLLEDEAVTDSLALLKEYAAELSFCAAHMTTMDLGRLCSNWQAAC